MLKVISGFCIDKISAWALRVPIEQTVETSFGVMSNRPAVFLRVEDSGGASGWGEVLQIGRQPGRSTV